MKKFITILSAVASIAICISSCSDSKSEANCTYYVSGDSITHTNSLDVKYDSIIGLYFVASQYVAYTYQESARSNEGMVSYAVEQCDLQAVQTFMAKSPKTLALNTVKNELYSQNQQYFNSNGITVADSIDLHPFTVNVSLWNYTYQGKLLDAKIEVQ